MGFIPKQFSKSIENNSHIYLFNSDNAENAHSRSHVFEGLKNKIHTAVRRNVEEIFEMKIFFKMSTGIKCRSPKVELQFYILVAPVQIKKNK